jgi:N6-L-threonylcarbamoyladenine synthase
MSQGPLVLGIETSCDETAAAVVAGGRRVLSNVIATQHELHRRYAGVVPEIASRAHLERIVPVVREALSRAAVPLGRLDAVAVGHRPGLIGSLLVGVSSAKALAWSLQRPLIGVDHVLAHLHAGLLDAEPVAFPCLGLVVSGGHTCLILLEDPLGARLLGRTLDDAAGEAFDKAAAILGLGYPGGPQIDALAMEGSGSAHRLPVPRLAPRERGGDFPFSFSGLKTALLYAVQGQPEGRGAGARAPGPGAAPALERGARADYAASFQQAVCQALLYNLERAWEVHRTRALLVGGGVSANSCLRRLLKSFAAERRIDLRLPDMAYCLDNAAMIAGAAAPRYEAGLTSDWSLAASPTAALT